MEESGKQGVCIYKVQLLATSQKNDLKKWQAVHLYIQNAKLLATSQRLI